MFWVAALQQCATRTSSTSFSECPYECNISTSGAVRACGDALRRAQRGRVARFEVSLNDATRGELDVMVSGDGFSLQFFEPVSLSLLCQSNSETLFQAISSPLLVHVVIVSVFIVLCVASNRNEPDHVSTTLF